MSIFDPNNKVKGNWMAFKNVGDKLEGTLIGKRVVNNALQGKDQIVYEIKRSDNGEVWNVGGKPGIDVQMRYIKPGQIVGFEFVQEKPASRPGFNKTKIIQVYANASVVDKEWLAGQEDEGVAVNGEPVSFKEQDTIDTPEEMLKKINNIAVEKLGATDAESVKSKVMEATNLAFIEANLAQILASLEELPDKK